MAGHLERGDGGVERVLGGGGELEERLRDPAVLGQVGLARFAAALDHGLRQQPRVDLDHGRLGGVVERPDRQAGGREHPQQRHPADRAGADRARTADLEDRLRLERRLLLGPPQRRPRGIVRWPLRTRPAPERGRAPREPRLPVALGRPPDVLDRGGAERASEPRREAEREVEADHERSLPRERDELGRRHLGAPAAPKVDELTVDDLADPPLARGRPPVARPVDPQDARQTGNVSDGLSDAQRRPERAAAADPAATHAWGGGAVLPCAAPSAARGRDGLLGAADRHEALSVQAR
ncbi:MAG: hypothetical protein AVDCRST_MAG85-758 [uncultured Solirubrobacteraceae bacterium]|uniref:Uncharacterized protein n=1 Tax=uncultured Solirubrobacteraceae bacterium TaxID=1162706 RepID=A0A6J4S3C9_9ACTN|nr:MAG: hypothetical protein AVDCRST_MAG85-758 [uncultured Solirubrobacteraceae bacterium]